MMPMLVKMMFMKRNQYSIIKHLLILLYKCIVFIYIFKNIYIYGFFVIIVYIICGYFYICEQINIIKKHIKNTNLSKTKIESINEMLDNDFKKRGVIPKWNM